jgi:PRTRC genetic system protein A
MKIPFPVVVNTRETELPEKGNYFIVGRDGLYLHKDTGLVQAVVKVSQASFLEPVETWAKLSIPVIPEELTRQMVAFFSAIYEKQKTEAVLLLFFSEKEGKFQWLCPAQEVSSARASFDYFQRVEESYQLVGTAHSHANMGAFHSSTDEHDESGVDGLHITVGRLGEDNIDICSSLAVNGNRFNVEPKSVMQGVEDAQESVKSVADRTRDSVDSVIDWALPGVLPFPAYRRNLGPRYHVDIQGVGFPAEWLERVEKSQFKFGVLGRASELNDQTVKSGVKDEIKSLEIALVGEDKCP